MKPREYCVKSIFVFLTLLLLCVIDDTHQKEELGTTSSEIRHPLSTEFSQFRKLYHRQNPKPNLFLNSDDYSKPKSIYNKSNINNVDKSNSYDSNHKLKRLKNARNGNYRGIKKKLLKCAKQITPFKVEKCLKKLEFLKSKYSKSNLKALSRIIRDFEDLEHHRVTRSLTKRRVLFPSSSDRDDIIFERPTPNLNRSPSHRDDRKSDAEPEIDDIIHGIMKLLGGNVKLTSSQNPETKLTTFGDPPHRYAVSRSRINDRGPPKLNEFPYIPQVPSEFSHPPIRSPIVPPSPISRVQGRPPFMANTRPPFLVPYPPSLNNKRKPNKPFLTGIPIPVNVLPDGADGDREDVTPPGDIVYSTVVEDGIVSTTLNGETTFGAELGDQEETTLVVDESTFVATLPSSISLTIDIPTTATPSLETVSGSLITPSVGSSLPSPAVPNESSTESQTKEDILSIVTSTSKSKIKSIISTTHLGTSTKASKESLPPKTGAKIPIKSTNIKTKPSSTPPLPPKGISTSFTFSGFPTRLPDPIRNFHTTGHPGLVLEDTAYDPGVVITAPPPGQRRPDVFDVTVSALQGYGAQTSTRFNGAGHLITSANVPSDGSVFIDGRKTYFDLKPDTAAEGLKTVGVGTVIPEAVEGTPFFAGVLNPMRPLPPPSPPLVTRRPQYRPPVAKKPPARTTEKPKRTSTLGPPKRIDTCIVGYDTTCKKALGEVCRTEGDVSSCYCKPGTARRRPRTICKKSVVLHLSMKVDKMGERRIQWGANYANPEAMEYQMLSYEAKKALDSAMIQARPMSNLFLGSFVNGFYSLGGRVIVNTTVKLLHTPQTSSSNIRNNLQRELIKVIRSNNQYIGSSALSVDGPLNPIPDVADVNECFDPNMNDCNEHASCTNTFGAFFCECDEGFIDRKYSDPDQSGRQCDSCSKDFCSKRGQCKILNGEKACVCDESYYGSLCEIDGEVIGVAVGASVAAVVIIVLTLIFLCMWSRRWKAQDRKTELLRRPWGFFGWRGRGMGGRAPYTVNLQKGSPYGVTIEDRIRWAQMADTIAHQNVYSPKASGSSQLDPTAAAAAVGCVPNTSTAASSAGIARGAPTDSSEYLSMSAPSYPMAMYNRVTRALSNSSKANSKGGFVDQLRRFIAGGASSRPDPPSSTTRVTPAEATITLEELVALQTQLNLLNQPEQMRPPPHIYPEKRKSALPPPSEYASVGTIHSTYQPQQLQQHFGMQHLSNPFFQQPPHPPPSTYGLYGPPSMNGASVGGISRAPTLGARTPLPLRDRLGGASMGPFGGASVMRGTKTDADAILGTESSEEDLQERSYHLPRPKSRGSVAVGAHSQQQQQQTRLGSSSDDIYFEPDDLMTSQPRRLPPLPSCPPPPIPHNHFDNFFKY